MAKKYDIGVAVRMVDSWRKPCPGEIDDKRLIQIGIQKERRRLRRLFGKKIKHIIYLQEGTKNIWYKNSECAIGVVAMGFSVKRLEQHPNAVPMEFYYDVFTNADGMISLRHLSAKQQDTISGLALTGREWLNMNDYVITS